MDRHRREYAADRLVADQERDHREDDGACESREIAELAGAEREVGIIGVLAGVVSRRISPVSMSGTKGFA